MTSIETDAPASSPAPAPAASGPSRARAGVLLAAVCAPIGAGALLVWLGFNAGGFFPGTVGFGAIAAGLALLVWLTTAQRPFEGASGALLIAVAALTLFAIWILASAGWSDSPARAIVEFDRSLLYVLLLLTAGLATGRLGGPRRILWGLAAGAVVVCAAGLTTRVAPDLWPIRQTLRADRLSYPVTYWNTLGLLGAMGWVLCLHLACSLREPRAARILAAAATPVLAATVYFTFSRGAILVVPIGIVAYLALARPRGAVGGLLAILPATVLAVVVAFGADALAADDPTTAAAVDQGRTVGIVILGAVVLAAVLRLAAAPVDRRMERLEVRLPSRRTLLAAGAALLVVVVVAGVAAGAPDRVRTQWQNFTQEGDVDPAGGSRDRLTEVGNNGRLDHWRVALKGYQASPLHGAGAGTYPNLWSRYRPQDFDVQDAHSLYVETLGELGIVGLALVLVLVLTLLGGTLRRVRGPDRGVAAAVFAVGLMWAVRAGLDWDWEMPVVTVWILLAGGAVLARPQAAEQARGGLVPGRTGRILLGIGVLVLLVTPALVAQSQGKLQESIRAFRAGDCTQAVDDALSSNSALSVRPEPFLVLGLCDVRIGQPKLGIAAIRGAIKRDPDNWQYRYSLALVKAASGIDPRPDARQAARMNPLSQITRDALQRFDSNDPDVWRRRSVTAPLPS